MKYSAWRFRSIFLYNDDSTATKNVLARSTTSKWFITILEKFKDFNLINEYNTCHGRNTRKSINSVPQLQLKESRRF